MNESVNILNYTGPVDYRKVDLLLIDLNKSQGLLNIDRVTGRRVYAIVVECLENIIKYSANETAGNLNKEPAISVIKDNDKIIIKAGNCIEADKTSRIIMKIDKINSLTDKELKVLFEKKINKKQVQYKNGIGLGFILMKMKSGNKIAVDVGRLEGECNYLELTISVNEYLA